MSSQEPSAAARHARSNVGMSNQQLRSVEMIVQALSNSQLASGLTHEQLLRLAVLAHIRTYADGDLICDEYEPGDELYVIEEGIVEAWIDPSSVDNPYGALRRISTLQGGEICGEIGMLDDGIRSAQLRAGPDGVKLIVFTKRGIMSLCEADTAIGYRVMLNLASTLAHRLRLHR